MKNRLGLVLSLCFFALCSIANAIPIYLLPGNADIAKNGTGGGGGNGNANNDASNLFRLETVLLSGPLNPALPAQPPPRPSWLALWILGRMLWVLEG